MGKLIYFFEKALWNTVVIFWVLILLTKPRVLRHTKEICLLYLKKPGYEDETKSNKTKIVLPYIKG